MFADFFVDNAATGRAVFFLRFINLKVFIVKYAKKCYYKFTDISFFRRIRK